MYGIVDVYNARVARRTLYWDKDTGDLMGFTSDLYGFNGILVWDLMGLIFIWGLMEFA